MACRKQTAPNIKENYGDKKQISTDKKRNRKRVREENTDR